MRPHLRHTGNALLCIVILSLAAHTAHVTALTVLDPFIYSQVTDHFDFENNATFQQRYWVSDKYWSNTGSNPVFLLLRTHIGVVFPCVQSLLINSRLQGPGGDNATADLLDSAITGWAKVLKAKLVELETRYSGQSNPVPSYSSHNLKYMNIDQILAGETFPSSFRQPGISPLCRHYCVPAVVYRKECFDCFESLDCNGRSLRWDVCHMVQVHCVVILVCVYSLESPVLCLTLFTESHVLT